MIGMKMMTMVTFFGVFLILTLGVMIGIGYVVYKDAISHGLNGWLWALVAVFTPSFVGIIIYLVIRSQESKICRCSICNAQVEVDYNVCPSCGTSFNRQCENCHKRVSPDYKLCPYCGEHLPVEKEVQGQILAIKKTGSPRFGRALAVLLIVIFGILLITFISVVIAGTSDSYSVTNVSLVENKSKSSRNYSNTFSYKSGTDVEKFEVIKGNNTGFEGDFFLDEGSVRVEIYTPSGELVDEKEIIGHKENVLFMINSGELGKYKVKFHYTKAKGNVEFKVY